MNQRNDRLALALVCLDRGDLGVGRASDLADTDVAGQKHDRDAFQSRAVRVREVFWHVSTVQGDLVPAGGVRVAEWVAWVSSRAVVADEADGVEGRI